MGLICRHRNQKVAEDFIPSLIHISSPISLSINEMSVTGLETRENKETQDSDLDHYHKGTVVDVEIPGNSKGPLMSVKTHENLTTLRHPLTPMKLADKGTDPVGSFKQFPLPFSGRSNL